MSTSAHASKPVKLDPTPHYPHIVLGLTLLSANPPRFHWLLFIPYPGQGNDKVQKGIKIHAVYFVELFIDGVPMGTWKFQAAPFTLATSEIVAAAAIIGQIKEKTVDELVKTLSVIPLEIPAMDRGRELVFSCRVWILEALRRLHGAGFIHCPDVNALEEEMWRHRVPAAKAVENGTFELAELVTAKNSRTL
ncbi:hypothetical protein V8D89_007634 [Ganoderma adspersum]